MQLHRHNRMQTHSHTCHSLYDTKFSARFSVYVSVTFVLKTTIEHFQFVYRLAQRYMPILFMFFKEEKKEKHTRYGFYVSIGLVGSSQTGNKFCF